MSVEGRRLRVLFAPWGNGNGHVMRTIVLARESRSQGWEPVVAVAGSAQAALATEHGISSIGYADSTAGLDPWLAWTDAKFWLTAIGNDRLLLRETSADLVVSDSRLSMHIAASLEGVPLVGIVQDMDFPYYTYPGRNREALWGGVEAALRETFAAHGLDYVMTDPRELIVSGGTVVPGTPDSDDVPQEWREGCVFVGPLTGFSRDGGDAASTVPDDAIVFYRTVHPNGDLEEFKHSFGELLTDVHIATGDPEVSRRLNVLLGDTGVKVADFWTIDADSRPKVAVIHGGHGTMLHMLQAGVPAIVVPDLSPERYANAVKAKNVASMQGVTEGVDLSELTWSAQSGGDSIFSFNDVRAAYDEFDLEQAQNSALEAARRYRSYSVEDAWKTIVEVSAVPVVG